MLDIKWIRDNPDLLDAALKKRNKPPCAAELITLDETYRTLLTQVQDLQNERNVVAKAFGEAKRKGESAADLGARAAEIKQLITTLEEQLVKAQNELEYLLAVTPNMARMRLTISS